MTLPRALLPALALLLAGCVSLPSSEDVRAFTLADESRLAARLAPELDSRLALHDDESAQRLLAEALRPLIEASALAERDWQVVLVDDPAPWTSHAPGGRVHVSTGLWRALPEDDQLRALLAHEVAHAELRHATLQLTRAHGRDAMLELSRGERPTLLADVAANLAASGTFARHGEEAERQADRRALELLAATGGDPASLSRALETQFEAAGGHRSTHFRAHPLSKRRFERIERDAARVGPSRGTPSPPLVRLRERISP